MLPLASEINSKEQISDSFTEEEFKLIENTLIKLVSGEITETQFCEENKVNDFFSWASKRRIVILNSQKLNDLYDSPADLPDTAQFYKLKNVFGLRNNKLSLIKLVLCHLYHEHKLIGVWDKINTEIFYKVLSLYIERGNERDLRILSNFANLEFIHVLNDNDLFQRYFFYDHNFPDPYTVHLLNNEDGDEDAEGEENILLNPNFLKLKFLQALQLQIQGLKF